MGASILEPNIYHDPSKVLHPYHVRIIRKKKQVFFRCCSTLEEARAFRKNFLDAEGNVSHE
jgi:hypothetical protein